MKTLLILDNTVMSNFALVGRAHWLPEIWPGALATRLGVPLSGTMGALRSLVHEGQISLAEANLALQEMVALGYRSPVHELC